MLVTSVNSFECYAAEHLHWYTNMYVNCYPHGTFPIYCINIIMIINLKTIVAGINFSVIIVITKYPHNFDSIFDYLVYIFSYCTLLYVIYCVITRANVWKDVM